MSAPFKENVTIIVRESTCNCTFSNEQQYVVCSGRWRQVEKFPDPIQYIALFFRLWKPKFQPMDMAITVPPFCVEDLLFVNLYSSLRDVKDKQINQYS